MKIKIFKSKSTPFGAFDTTIKVDVPVYLSKEEFFHRVVGAEIAKIVNDKGYYINYLNIDCDKAIIRYVIEDYDNEVMIHGGYVSFSILSCDDE